MIKKFIKIVIEDTGEVIEDSGGIPLSKGEIVRMHNGESITEYLVQEKTVDCESANGDWIVDIEYRLKKQ